MAEDSLRDTLRQGYSFAEDGEPEPPHLLLGRPLTSDLDTIVPEVPVRIPLRMLNRHGLVAGATGTGKTKTLQLIAEQLSEQGVPVFLADLKGDLTGLAEPAVPGDVEGFLTERMTSMGFEVGAATDERSPVDGPDGHGEPPLWRPRRFPVELLSLTGDDGLQVRVPLEDFGPLLLAKVMDCTDVQASVLQVVFHYAADSGRRLATLDDLDAVLRHLTSDAGAAVEEEYGGMSRATLDVLRRGLVVLEGQGADRLFGDPGFDVTSLWRSRDGEPFGVVTVLRLVDVQTRPRLFSTVMMWLLSSVYANADEVGDLDRPRLVFFLDEAHLLFDGASDALLELVELTVRMIRSKGIGVFFVTQRPDDVPEEVLAQLGTRVQHALRAFTPKDRAALDRAAATYPVTEHYDVRRALTDLGIGEGLVVGLGRRGAPTPTVATRLVGPRSSMDPVTEERLDELAAATRRRHDQPEATATTRPSPTTADDLVAGAAPTPALAAASAAVSPAADELVRVLAHRCALVRPARPVSRHARVVRTGAAGSSSMRRDLTRDVVAVADGLGELALTADELVFVAPGGEVRLRRDDVEEVQYLHGLVVVAGEAFLVDPDDQRDLLAAWDPTWAWDDLTALGLPPDDLLDELAALDDAAVAAGVPGHRPAPATGGARPADARPDPAGPDDRPPDDAPVGDRTDDAHVDDRTDDAPVDDRTVDGPGVGERIADVASSTGVEEVAATVGKMLGVNKGTTRSLFRAWRKARR